MHDWERLRWGAFSYFLQLRARMIGQSNSRWKKMESGFWQTLASYCRISWMLSRANLFYVGEQRNRIPILWEEGKDVGVVIKLRSRLDDLLATLCFSFRSFLPSPIKPSALGSKVPWSSSSLENPRKAKPNKFIICNVSWFVKKIV